MGEAQRVRESRSGHLYFELVEKGQGDGILGKLDAVVWRGDLQRIRRRMRKDEPGFAEGVEIRCRIQVDFYPPAGRLQLIVRELDPLFAMGQLERRRRETLAQLEAAGLLERQNALQLPDIPLTIGLITSDESAAYHDFLAGLIESDYGFRVLFVHAAVQGTAAEQEIPSALKRLGRIQGLEAIALIRGGGARTDLAAFDSRAVAEAVAKCPLPVLTGLGHEIDLSIADLAAHTSLKTPTKVAEHLIERVLRADQNVEACQEALVRLATRRVERAQEALVRYERLAQSATERLSASARVIERMEETLRLVASGRLRTARRGCEEASERLVRATERRLERERSRPDELAQRIAQVASAHLREQRAVLEGRERLCRELAPEQILQRGFSITRGASGALIRDSAQVQPGERLQTRLAEGVVTSRVEEET